MILKIFVATALIFTSCAQLDNLVEEPVRCERCPSSYEVTVSQWDCCTGLCDAKPARVTVEAKTGYLVCECRKGTKFRVTKMASAREFERI